jgi:hypothetical protein
MHWDPCWVAFPAAEALLLRSDRWISIASVCRVSLKYLIKDPYGSRSCAMVPTEVYQSELVPSWILYQIRSNWSEFLIIASLISIVLICHHDLEWAEGFSHASSGAEPLHILPIHNTDWYRVASYQIWWIQLMLLMIASSIGIALAYGYDLKWVKDLLLTVNCAEALVYWKCAVSIGTGFNFFPIWDAYWTCILNEQPSGLKAHPILAGASGSLRFLLNSIDLYKRYTDLTELMLFVIRIRHFASFSPITIM